MEGNFACVDPEAACVNDDDVTIDMVENCGWIGSIGELRSPSVTLYFDVKLVFEPSASIDGVSATSFCLASTSQDSR